MVEYKVIVYNKGRQEWYLNGIDLHQKKECNNISAKNYQKLIVIR